MKKSQPLKSSTCIEKIGEGVRAEAIHKAKENARSTASQMRVKLGKITNIQDLHVEVKKLHGTTFINPHAVGI